MASVVVDAVDADPVVEAGRRGAVVVVGLAVGPGKPDRALASERRTRQLGFIGEYFVIKTGLTNAF